MTGQETINGVVAPNTGVTATNKIFSTVWTQGARATYDLSNFVDNQVADLRPGHWSTFSQAQLADLNSNADAGTPQFKAQGNVYNALLYNGNTHSLVNNIVTGSGNDRVTGNAANNKITAGAGDDVIDGDGGHDIDQRRRRRRHDRHVARQGHRARHAGRHGQRHAGRRQFGRCAGLHRHRVRRRR